MIHRKEGKDSPWSKSLVKKIKDEGWYFKGEYYPDNEVTTRRLLRKKVREGSLKEWQADAFLKTHFGEFTKTFEVSPRPPEGSEVPEELEPIAERVTPSVRAKIREKQGPVVHGKPGAKRPELGVNERSESDVRGYAETQKITFDQAVKQYESEGLAVVRGR